jgi:sortase (surface protein transpeptidase)
MSSQHPTWVASIVLALLLVACGGGPDPAVPGAKPAPGTTEQTLAAIRAMDPERLAGLHDRGHTASHEHRPDQPDDAPSRHPNGVDPERIVIPAIGVDADVIDLGLRDDGAMEVPADFGQAGWFTPGPRPGRVGPAVIAGHVDSRTGPAVFFRLPELEVGDEIDVHGEDGEVVTFVVRASEQHAKDDFPTERVYAGTPGPELRLITCGGVFDQSERSYRDNLIVYAERVGS